MIHVDKVPDAAFALAQIQKMPEVRCAAVFEDGLIALGCSGPLPAALAEIAVPAEPTTPQRATGFNGLKRIEEVSSRLEKLVDAMEPEEVILNESLSRVILERLDQLEGKMAAARGADELPALDRIEAQIATLTDRMDALASHDAVAALNALHERGFADPSDMMQKIDKRMAELQKNVSNSAFAAQAGELEKAVKSLSRSVQTTHATQGMPAQILDRIDQIGSAQRTAFTRVEAAMAKAVSGLEPALEHLNARIADTENTITDWQKDLRTLAKQTKTVADTTATLPPMLSAMQADVSEIATKPVPELDLTGQNEGFANFTSHLVGTLDRMEDITRQANERSAALHAQFDDARATLQSLPELVSAGLQHDGDLSTLKSKLVDLGTQLTSLHEGLRLCATADQMTTLQEGLQPIREVQNAEFDALQNANKYIHAQVDTLVADVAQLLTREISFEPIQDSLSGLQQEAHQMDAHRETQLAAVQDMISGLAQHLGLRADHATQVVPATTIMPEASMNTLRMEFADLITQRIKESNPPFSPRPKQA
ncbi:MAG: hypothetical protein AAF943_08015 [Pseudomonadota bacterium]